MSILQMSISAGVLVIAIVLIRAVALNWLPKKMFLVLWCVVLFRLLVPFSIPLPFSIQSAVSEVSRTIIPDNLVLSVVENLTHTVDNATGIMETSGTVEQIADLTQKQDYSMAPTTAIWLVGMLFALLFFTVIHYKNQKRLRFATAIRDNDYLNEWIAEHRHIRPIAITQSDRIISPLTAGIFNPRIILPKSMNMSDKQLLDYVLTHEYYHIRRFDVIWKMVLLLALCVHWFNPVVWVMFVLANRDLELTCDEAVLHCFGMETKKDYAKILIGMVEQRGRSAPLHNGFSKNATQERIVSIMKIKKNSMLAIVIAALLVAGATTVFALAIPDRPDRDVDSSLPDNMSSDSALLVYIDEDYSENDARLLQNQIRDVPNVSSAIFVNSQQAMDEVMSYAENAENIEHIEVSDFRARYKVYIVDIALIEQTIGELRGIQGVNKISFNGEVLLGADDYSLEGRPIETDSMPGILVAVNRNDESRYTPEEWADILEKVEKGEILFFETREEEVDYFYGRTSAQTDNTLLRPTSVAVPSSDDTASMTPITVDINNWSDGKRYNFDEFKAWVTALHTVAETYIINGTMTQEQSDKLLSDYDGFVALLLKDGGTVTHHLVNDEIVKGFATLDKLYFELPQLDKLFSDKIMVWSMGEIQ